MRLGASRSQRIDPSGRLDPRVNNGAGKCIRKTHLAWFEDRGKSASPTCARRILGIRWVGWVAEGSSCRLGSASDEWKFRGWIAGIRAPNASDWNGASEQQGTSKAISCRRAGDRQAGRQTGRQAAGSHMPEHLLRLVICFQSRPPSSFHGMVTTAQAGASSDRCNESVRKPPNWGGSGSPRLWIWGRQAANLDWSTQ